MERKGAHTRPDDGEFANFDLLLAIKRTFSKTGLISSVNLQALAVDLPRDL